MWFRVTSMSIHSGQRVEKRADVAAEGSHASAVCDFPLNDRSLVPLPPTLPNLAPRSPEIPSSPSTNRSKRPLYPSPSLRFSVDDPFCAEDRDATIEKRKSNRNRRAFVTNRFISSHSSPRMRQSSRFSYESNERVTSNVPFSRVSDESFIYRPVSYIYGNSSAGNYSERQWRNSSRLVRIIRKIRKEGAKVGRKGEKLGRWSERSRLIKRVREKEGCGPPSLSRLRRRVPNPRSFVPRPIELAAS